MGSISLIVKHIRQCEVHLCRLRSFVPHVQLPQLEQDSSEANTRLPTLPQQNSETCEISNAQTSIPVAEVQPVLVFYDTSDSDRSEEELESDCESGMCNCLCTM